MTSHIRRPDRVVGLLAAAVVFAIHAAGNAHYGFFRDELYFIICGRHPQFGYVDQPPLVPLLAAATQIFGHSLFLLRIVPALFAAGGVYATCALVREFGGSRFAQGFAALIFLFTPVLLSFGGKVSTDEVGLCTWPLLVLLIVRLVNGADPRVWLGVGAVVGITLESKYSLVFVLVALLVGLLATRERRLLANRWTLAGACLAMAIVLPNLAWQWHNGFPMLELLRAGQEGKNLIAGPLLFVAQQLLITNVFLAPVWIVGLVWTLRTAQFRFIGIAYLVLIVEMIVLHGKHYYPANIYPVLIAAGAVPIEAWTRRLAAVRGVAVAYAACAGLVFVPIVLPVLPENAFVTYQDRLYAALHIPRSAIATEHERETTALPGDWADMHGWPEIAAAAARAYNALPPGERSRAVVFSGNYGEASAVAFFEPDVPVISDHNQYWLWGTRGYDGRTVVQINGTCFASEHLFASRTLAARVNTPWTIGWETNIPIWICRGISKPLAQEWPQIKDYE
jgi:hypothetical protein